MTPNEMTKECLDINWHRAANATGERSMSNFFNYLRVRISLILSTLLCASLLVTPLAFAENSAAQQVFPSPAAATNALLAADKAADMNARDDFARCYDEMHRLEYDDQGRVILYIGANNWPVPIPLVKNSDGWAFDTAAGKEELLYRRIGRNELFTIKVLEDLAEAQTEYARDAHDGETAGRFARKILSDTGKQDGLYWATAEGQPESPIGPLVASATEAGYKKDAGGSPIPFHGYYYKVLTGQGTNALGGAKNYLVDGKMTQGFAFLAYPAEYRASGVMTFM